MSVKLVIMSDGCVYKIPFLIFFKMYNESVIYTTIIKLIKHKTYILIKKIQHKHGGLKLLNVCV